MNIWLALYLIGFVFVLGLEIGETRMHGAFTGERTSLVYTVWTALLWTLAVVVTLIFH